MRPSRDKSRLSWRLLTAVFGAATGILLMQFGPARASATEAATEGPALSGSAGASADTRHGAAGTARAARAPLAGAAGTSAAVASATASHAVGSAVAASTGTQSLAPFVPTPQDVVERMLELAQVTKNDVVYDLGCGDGRLVITAAKKYGARGVGIDIDPERIAESQANAKKAGVESMVQFRMEDALSVDVSSATVVTLYLLSSSNMKLRPILTKQLKPGSRIVSHQFSMGDWQADKTETFTDSNGSTRTLYLWTLK